MRRSGLLMVAIASAILAIAGLTGPVMADCGLAIQHLRRIGDARGTTFEGVYLGRVGAHNHDAWSVIEVFAGGPLGQRYEVEGSLCQPLDLKPGTAYLYSTSAVASDGDDVGVTNSVAWAIARNGSASLVTDPYHEYVDYPRPVQRVTALAGAIALMAPGLPPTDLSGEGSRPYRRLPEAALLAVGLGLAAGCWVLLRRPFRPPHR